MFIRIFSAILLFLFNLPLSAEITFTPQLENILIKAQGKAKLPGCAMAIVEGDKIIYAKGFGTRRVGFDEPVDTNTLFQIGSVTKGVTATLIAKLMTEGKIDWNTQVKRYYEGFGLSYKYHTEELTLKDVLAQRSGLPLYAGDNYIEQGKDYKYVLTQLRKYKKLDKLRSAFSYQNSLYCVTQPAIQKVTGKSWDHAIQEDLLKPIGIFNASTSYDHIVAEPNSAKPHKIMEKEVTILPWSRFGSRVPAAGGLIMNIKDLARYVSFHLSDGKNLISPPLMKELHSNQVFTNTKMTNYKKYFFPKERVKSSHYCLGLRGCDWAGHKVICHGGYVNGQQASITFLPEKKLGIVMLSNAGSYVPAVMHASFLDMALNLPTINWLQHAEVRLKTERLARKEAAKNIKPKKKRNIAKAC